MKRKYKNITVPYRVWDKKENYTYYIYNDKKYYELNELFKDFVDYELTYHIEINKKEKEFHNLTDVIEQLLLHPKTFKISKKYYDEYSKDELSYINKLQKNLINNMYTYEGPYSYKYKFRLKDLPNLKTILYEQKISKKYKDIRWPKKIYSKEFKHHYFVSCGQYYQNITYAVEEVYQNNFYYQYGGPNRENYYNHFHSHEFSEVINDVFNCFDKFKIHKFQEEYFSNQELELLNKICTKLKQMKYKPLIREWNESVYEEYCYLKDNKKYLSLLVFNIKNDILDYKEHKEKLKSHKI